MYRVVVNGFDVVDVFTNSGLLFVGDEISGVGKSKGADGFSYLYPVSSCTYN